MLAKVICIARNQCSSALYRHDSKCAALNIFCKAEVVFIRAPMPSPMRIGELASLSMKYHDQLDVKHAPRVGVDNHFSMMKSKAADYRASY